MLPAPSVDHSAIPQVRRRGLVARWREWAWREVCTGEEQTLVPRRSFVGRRHDREQPAGKGGIHPGARTVVARGDPDVGDPIRCSSVEQVPAGRVLEARRPERQRCRRRLIWNACGGEGEERHAEERNEERTRSHEASQTSARALHNTAARRAASGNRPMSGEPAPAEGEQRHAGYAAAPAMADCGLQRLLRSGRGREVRPGHVGLQGRTVVVGRFGAGEPCSGSTSTVGRVARRPRIMGSGHGGAHGARRSSEAEVGT